MAPTFSIIIVNYNSARAAITAIETFIAAHRRARATYEFIIVDNHSAATDQQALRHFCQPQTHLTFLSSNKNLGFGAANNYAVRQSRGEHLLFLNPDTVCQQNLLDPILTQLKQPAVGLVAPQLTLSDGSPQPFASGAFPTLANIFCAKMKPNSSLSFKSKSQQNPSAAIPVAWVSAACFAISAKNFQLLDGFDESFFMYFEDIDLCRRAQEFHLQNYLLPNLAITHVGGERTRLTRSRRASYFAAQKKYFYKWRRKNFFGTYHFYLFLILRLPYKLIRYCTDLP